MGLECDKRRQGQGQPGQDLEFMFHNHLIIIRMHVCARMFVLNSYFALKYAIIRSLFSGFHMHICMHAYRYACLCSHARGKAYFGSCSQCEFHAHTLPSDNRSKTYSKECVRVKLQLDSQASNLKLYSVVPASMMEAAEGQ
jgi:hypothetical protein